MVVPVVRRRVIGQQHVQVTRAEVLVLLLVALTPLDYLCLVYSRVALHYVLRLLFVVV